LSNFNDTGIFWTVFRKNIKFYENLFSGSRRLVACGWTDGQTDMKTLIVTLRDFANAPKNSQIKSRAINKNL